MLATVALTLSACDLADRQEAAPAVSTPEWFLDTVRPGTPVYLIGGKYPAIPFPPEA